MHLQKLREAKNLKCACSEGEQNSKGQATMSPKQLIWIPKKFHFLKPTQDTPTFINFSTSALSTPLFHSLSNMSKFNL